MAINNYSIYAIPAYFFITMVPHQYSVYLIKSSNNGRWNNANPRSSKWNESIQKSVPAEVFSRYERARAAHKNGLENFSIFATAIILGNMAELPTSTLNTVAGVYLAMRVLYTMVYLSTTKNKSSYLRTAIYIASSSLLSWQIILAGNIFARRSTTQQRVAGGVRPGHSTTG